ncbi:MAG: putative Se/S carrier-like protein [Candidatus Gallimonas sp.]
MTTLAVFRSRAQTLDFIAQLRSGGVPASAVNTPKEAGVGCGISAKFEESFLPRAQYYIKKKPYSSFAGFMRGSAGFFSYLPRG